MGGEGHTPSPTLYESKEAIMQDGLDRAMVALRDEKTIERAAEASGLKTEDVQILFENLIVLYKQNMDRYLHGDS